MSERTQDVEGETLSALDVAMRLNEELRHAIGHEQAMHRNVKAERDRLRSEREEAEALAREWTNLPPEKFESLPRKTSIEILCFGLYLYAKGLRAALSRKDAALREIRYQASEMKGAGSKGRTLAEIEDIADRALASEPGQEGGEDG